MKNMDSAVSLGRFIKSQDWDPAEALSALILHFAGLAYQLGITLDDANGMSKDTIEHLYKSMDEMVGKGRGVLQ